MTLAVRIRLTRVGATKRPSYRVVAIERRRARDGRALEILGFYDPLTEPATVTLETEKIQAWIGKGAQPSETVVRLMRQAEKAATAQPAAKPARATATATRATATRPKTTRKPRAASTGAKGATPKAEAAAPAATEPEAATGEAATGEAATGEAATGEAATGEAATAETAKGEA
jgi:small subunit ribosomal protein S16